MQAYGYLLPLAALEWCGVLRPSFGAMRGNEGGEMIRNAEYFVICDRAGNYFFAANAQLTPRLENARAFIDPVEARRTIETVTDIRRFVVRRVQVSYKLF
jgi:hypothetical protein